VLIGGTQQILRVSVDVTAVPPEADDADPDDADSQASRPLTA